MRRTRCRVGARTVSAGHAYCDPCRDWLRAYARRRRAARKGRGACQDCGQAAHGASLCLACRLRAAAARRRADREAPR